MAIDKQAWWKKAVVYQIYPASFQDSNGDGIGDLQGIISRLDYIASLGVNVIWLCPIYDSPQVDMGYDISNYEDIYRPYGTLDDMKQLIRECHARGLRVMMDLVINHTSSEHPWFQESRTSKDNPKRDWYIWRPAKYDAQGKRQPPNNWRSNFGGGSAWEWDEATQEYYLHLFAVEQPDLNWENAEMRRALYATSMEFWLDRGIDGFRIDTVNMYSKQPGLGDAPVADPWAPYHAAHTMYCNGPRMHEFLNEMRAIFRRYDAVTVGELAFTSGTEHVLEYVSAAHGPLDMVFQFDVVEVGKGPIHRLNVDVSPRPWHLPDLKRAVDRTQALIRDGDGWSTVFMENHDQARSVSRFGNDTTDALRVASAKMLALLQATLSGTLYMYQGQEIGIVNPSLASYPVSQYKDIDTLLFLQDYSTNADGTVCPEKRAKTERAAQHMARDHARIPMVWDGTVPSGGFSTAPEGATWMAPHPLAKQINVADQLADETSVLAYWKQVLALRRAHSDVLVHGRFDLVDADDETLFTYRKTNTATGHTALVVLNFCAASTPWTVPTSTALGLPGDSQAAALPLSLVESSAGTKDASLDLLPYEGRVYLVG